MRPDEVPSQSSPLLQGVLKAAYALGPDGRYIVVPNGGTEDEIAAAEETAAWFEHKAGDARRRALAGETSPLEYHMYRCRMGVLTLAQATGFWRLTVRRHLRPKNFARLSQKKLARYAGALGIDDPETLRVVVA